MYRSPASTSSAVAIRRLRMASGSSRSRSGATIAANAAHEPAQEPDDQPDETTVSPLDGRSSDSSPARRHFPDELRNPSAVMPRVVRTSPFSVMAAESHRCPKTARRGRSQRFSFSHREWIDDATAGCEPRPPCGSTTRPAIRALAARDAAVRRPLLRGGDDDADLLPADLHGADAGPRPLPVLRQRGAGGARGFPALPAMPARAGARACPGRRASAGPPGSRPTGSRPAR